VRTAAKFASLAALVCLAGALVWAQGPTQPGYIHVYIAKIKPDKLATYEKIAQKWADAFRKEGGENWITIQQEVGEYNTIAFVSFRKSWADLDKLPNEMEVLSKVYGKQEAENIFKTASECELGGKIYFRKTRPDLSLRAKQDDIARAKYLRVSYLTVRPGRAPDFEYLVKKAIEAHQKLNTDVHFTIYQTVSGGALSYVITTTAGAYADFDYDPGNVIEKAFGAEEYNRFRASLAEVVERGENIVWRIRPELSAPPQEYIAANPNFWTPKPAVVEAVAEKAPTGARPATKKEKLPKPQP
jgi:hypothetical protein